ncbi:MAG: hypothetical protein H7Y01_02075, partial [Ferruginibacter sp.]|nr:hypothetical protein [Chitinophagaceae bacterium]
MPEIVDQVIHKRLLGIFRRCLIFYYVTVYCILKVKDVDWLQQVIEGAEAYGFNGIFVISSGEDDIKIPVTGPVKKMLGAILIEMGFITESALGGVLTAESGVKIFDVKKA